MGKFLTSNTVFSFSCELLGLRIFEELDEVDILVRMFSLCCTANILLKLFCMGLTWIFKKVFVPYKVYLCSQRAAVEQ